MKLNIAIRLGNIDKVKEQIAAGANVNARTFLFKKTPLMIAASYGNTDVIKYLKKNGANIDATNIFGMNALMYAAGKGYDKNVLSHLINENNINATDNEGKTALIYAIQSGQLKSVQHLVKSGAKTNITYGMFKLNAQMIANMNNYADIANYLYSFKTTTR